MSSAIPGLRNSVDPRQRASHIGVIGQQPGKLSLVLSRAVRKKGKSDKVVYRTSRICSARELVQHEQSRLPAPSFEYTPQVVP